MGLGGPALPSVLSCELLPPILPSFGAFGVGLLQKHTSCSRNQQVLQGGGMTNGVVRTGNFAVTIAYLFRKYLAVFARTSCSAVADEASDLGLVSGLPLNTFFTRFHLDVMVERENTASSFRLSRRPRLSERQRIFNITKAETNQTTFALLGVYKKHFSDEALVQVLGLWAVQSQASLSVRFHVF